MGRQALPAHAPGSVALVSPGAFQANRIKNKFRKADEFIADYFDLQGLATECVIRQWPKIMLHDAFEFMHVVLPRDMCPPWFGQRFPKALPGDGMLSKLTRP